MSDCIGTFEKETLPPGITTFDQWVTWGNMDVKKCPTQPISVDRAASSTDPDTWGTLDDALQYVTSGEDGRGLGFVFTGDDPYLAFDIDCPDHTDASLPPWLPSLDILGCSAWVCRTPSRAGWRIIVKADSEDVIPDWWTDISDEYDGETREIALTYANKYMTVTDDVLADHRVPGEVTAGDLDTWLQAAYTLFTNESPRTTTNDGATRVTRGETANRTGEIPDLSIYDIISRAKYPQGKRTTHPFHGSGTGRNFQVDDDTDADSWGCWRHGITGHAGHLLGMEMGVLSCEDVEGHISGKEWAEIYEKARQRGYDIPDPRSSAGGDGADDSPPPGDCGSGSGDREKSGDEQTTSEPDIESEWEQYHDTVAEDTATEGNAVATDLLLDEFDVRTDRESETIYVYDDETGVYSPYGEETLRSALMDPKRMGDKYSRHHGNEILHQVKARSKIPPDTLGGSPTTVVVANGTLDWNDTPAGMPRLRDYSPDDNALTALPVAFDPDATCPRWKEFVNEVVEDGMEATVQEYVGYCLVTNDMPFHKALMIVGDGANGKSQFLYVVKQLLGEDNYTSHSLQEVSENSFARAQLFQSLANIHGDLSPVALGPDSMFKTLVGGDTVTAEQKYKPPFQFDPTTKHIYATNQVPEIHVNDDAFFRRWLLVEFPNTFSGDDRIANLGRKIFEEEAAGILNWALEGRRRLFSQEGFTNDGTPAETRARWTQWGSSVAQFIEDCLTATGNDADRLTSSEIYEGYQKYVKKQADESGPVSQQKLTQEVQSTLTGPSYGSYQFDDGKARGFIGLSLTDE